MKKLNLLVGLLVFCVLLGYGTVQAKATQHNIAADMTDGSHLRGTIQLMMIPLKTPFGKLKIPIEQISRVTMLADKKSTQVLFRNSDHLTGHLQLNELQLDTVFGRIRLPLFHLKRFSILGPDYALPPTLTKDLALYLSFDTEPLPKQIQEHISENITKVHGATWAANGKVGGAYSFDGVDDYLELQPSNQYKAAEKMSVCAWVYRQDDAVIILSNYHGGGTYNGQFMFEYDGHQQLDVAFGQGHGDGVSLRYRSADKGLLPSNEWHHVAFSYNEARGPGKKSQIFLDGESIRKYQIQGEGNGKPVLDNKEKLRIMRHRAGTSQKGLVDEVMLWKRALTPEEIKAIYLSQK